MLKGLGLSLGLGTYGLGLDLGLKGPGLDGRGFSLKILALSKALDKFQWNT